MNKTNHALKKNKAFEPLVKLPYPAKILPFSRLATPPHNLATPFTSFIGREEELLELSNLLNRREVRLVTLTGMGGTGKTRLSQALAHRLLPKFADGVYFVDLASISNPDLIAGLIAQTLELKDNRASPSLAVLKTYLKDRQMLLVLDNFEQLLSGSKIVAELLSISPQLKIVVTSREVLQIYGEQPYEVPLLETPDTRVLPELEQLTRNTAVNLFVARARTVKPDFNLDENNALPVAELCVLLEGLPLAIEIAAVSSRIYTPQAFLNRLLVARLRLPAQQSQNLPRYQQSLLSVIQWSYDLLQEDEKKLFRHLAIFRGSFGAEAVEAVCNEGAWVEEHLQALVSKSLVQVQETPAANAPLFSLRESIREFALERLTENHELETATQAFTAYYLAQADKATQELTGAQEVVWLKGLIYEQANFRAVLDNALQNGNAGNALQIAGGLWQFWWISGQLSEGRKWLEEALALQSTESKQAHQANFALGDLLQLALPKQNEPVKPPKVETPLIELTRREVEVLRLVAQGLTNQEVAQKLVISAGTVNVHLNSIYGKLEVRSRTAAAHYAVQHKMI
jgi:predicted ATPase/DNA-binding CsgD family transcriptional regulator